MLQNFLRRAPGSAGNVGFFYTLAQGEMLPNFLRGVFPGVAASYWAFPLVTKGRCCPIFRGAPGECLEAAAFYTLAQGEMLPNFSRCVFPGVAARYWVFPLVTQGKCCPIFRVAPGECLEPAVCYPTAQGEMLPIFFWHSRGWVEASPSRPNS